MIRNSLLKNLLFTLISLLPIAYLLMVWDTLPAVVPTHFGAKGPNGYGSKPELLAIISVVAAAGIGTYFLLQNMHKIDPKRAAKPQAPVFNKMAAGLVFFMSAINLLIVHASAHPSYNINQLMYPLVGLFLAFIGNMMYSLKPNYFAGIKVAWTLSSDYNWRKTHQLAGKIWFVGGILLTLASLVLNYDVMEQVLIFVVIIFTVVPIGYSYLIFRREQANPGIGTGEEK